MDIPFIPAHSSNYARGRTAPILWIVVHYTANDGDTDTNNAHYFQGAGRGASAHYFVDEDSITQTVRDSDTAWHCGAERGGSYFNGARNANSIGIEMCSDVVGGRYTITEQTAARTAGLVRSLMDKYNIPLSRVCRHYDVTHKACPEPWVRNPQLWEDFKRRLVEEEESGNPSGGMVADGGQVYLSGVPQEGTLAVSWIVNNQSQSCTLHFHLPDNPQQSLNTVKTVSGLCQTR